MRSRPGQRYGVEREHVGGQAVRRRRDWPPDAPAYAHSTTGPRFAVSELEPVPPEGDEIGSVRDN